MPLARLVYGDGNVPPGATMPDGYAGRPVAPLPPNPLPERMDFRGALRVDLPIEAGRTEQPASRCSRSSAAAPSCWRCRTSRAVPLRGPRPRPFGPPARCARRRLEAVLARHHPVPAAADDARRLRRGQSRQVAARWARDRGREPASSSWFDGDVSYSSTPVHRTVGDRSPASPPAGPRRSAPARPRCRLRRAATPPRMRPRTPASPAPTVR